MLFETAGNPATPKKGMLLHAMAVDNRQFDALCRHLTGEYFLILPIFDGHYKAGKTVFSSSENQAAQIVDYLEMHGICELDFIAGVSLGALVAFEIYRLGRLKVRKYMFDGGPFFLLDKPHRAVMRHVFWSALWLLKTCPRFSTRIAEKKFGREIAQIAADVVKFITKQDIYNLVNHCFCVSIPATIPNDSTNLTFLYGSRENARRSFVRFRALPTCELIVMDGYGHCQFLAEQSAEYADILRV
jgi:pimeloyl-ACP methyl ester carboxylesterase